MATLLSILRAIWEFVQVALLVKEQVETELELARRLKAQNDAVAARVEREHAKNLANAASDKQSVLERMREHDDADGVS